MELHCPAGLIQLDQDYLSRLVNFEMVSAIGEQEMLPHLLTFRSQALEVTAK